jgi:hypothetical protein
MFKHKVATRRILARSQSGLAIGAVVGLALFAAACKDSSSSIVSPMRQLSASNVKSVATTNFTVLANAAVTCTHGTIAGDVGTFLAPPKGSFTRTGCPMTGTVHLGDGSAIAAYAAFLSAYAALAPQPNDVCPIITGTLDGVTLPPGTYCVSEEAKTGVLTLAGPSNGIWIFKVAADGTGLTGALTGTNFTVNMVGGSVCNVTWWVSQAATLTDSHFIGTILAGAAITLTRGTFDGNVYSQADVTITGTDVTGCLGGGGGPQPQKCNQGVGNGPEFCDPGNSNNHNSSNDENGGIPGKPGRQP